MYSTQMPWFEWGRRGWPLLVVLPALLAYAPDPGHAEELLVLESTTRDLKPGDVANTGSSIEVPHDASVTLLAASGGVLRIEGPWRGKIEPLDDAGGNLIGRLVALLQMPPPRSELGVARGTCVSVDLDEDRDVCVGPPTCIVFEHRQKIDKPIVIDGPDGKAFELQPLPGGDSWSWPNDLALKSGTYLIWTGADRAPIELRLHQQPEVPSRAHAISWMAGAGCTRQAQEALRHLQR